jgi:hypothetical protein
MSTLTWHTLPLISASLTFVSAVIAAVYWFRSSRIRPKTVSTENGPSISDIPEVHILAAQVDIFGIHDVINEISRLNKLAAIWTGISALLGAVTTMSGLINYR